MPLLRVGAAGTLLFALAGAASAQVVLVAGAKSAAGALTTDQAAALYLGKTDKVPGLATAQLMDQHEASTVRDEFYSKLTGKTAAQVKAAWTRLVFSGKAQLPKEVASDAEMKKALDTNPNAIGYIDKSAVDASVKVLLSIE